MREKFARFMAGRYGMDAMGRFLMALVFVFIILNMFISSPLLDLLAWASLIYMYFRAFSRDIYKRSSENQKFLQSTYKFRCWFNKQKNIFAQRKTHHIYKCPNCKQKIRVPRGKGRIEIRCPKCSTTFIKKS